MMLKKMCWMMRAMIMNIDYGPPTNHCGTLAANITTKHHLQHLENDQQC